MTTQEASSKVVNSSKLNSEHEQFIKNKLNASNFESLRAGSERGLTVEADIRAANNTTLNAQIDQLKEYARSNGNDAIAVANKELCLPEASVETWTAGPGDFSITSTYKWAVGGGVTFPGQLPLAFLFGGTGESWKAWATGTTVILGSFVVDPQIIVKSKEFREENSPIGRVRKGPCRFTASGGGAGISGVTISFYSMDGVFWGTLTGTGAMLGGFSIEGELELIWQGWK